MAQFRDLRYEELKEIAPGVIFTGLSGTVTLVTAPESERELGFIVRLNSWGRRMGRWAIRPGGSYRITPGRVRRLPYPENDQNAPRRFCRERGLPLTRLQTVERGEQVAFLHPLHQGETGIRSIEPGDPSVKFVGVETTRGKEWKILLACREIPTNYEAVVKMIKTTADWQEGWMGVNI